MSAAEHVFGVAELLEKILLHLSDPNILQYRNPDLLGDDEEMDSDQEIQSDIDEDESDLESEDECEEKFRAWTTPITELFTLLRVNKTFKATIEGSKMLRRIMRLEDYPVAASNDKAGSVKFGIQHETGAHLLFPAAFRGKPLVPGIPDPFHEPVIEIYEGCITLFWENLVPSSLGSGTPLESYMTRREAAGVEKSTRNPEPSWRKIKIHPGKVQSVVHFSFDLHYGMFGMTATLNSEATLLGDLYDLVIQVLKQFCSKGKTLASEHETASKIMMVAWQKERPARSNTMTKHARKFEKLMQEHEKSCQVSNGGACAVCSAIEDSLEDTGGDSDVVRRACSSLAALRPGCKHTRG